MKGIGIVLIILGGFGILLGFMMYGDIGIACLVGATASLFSGIGFIMVSKKFDALDKSNNNQGESNDVNQD